MGDRVDIALLLEWQSDCPAGPVRHRDACFAEAVDFASDVLPAGIGPTLAMAEPGVRIEKRLGLEALRDAGTATVAVHAAQARFAGTLPDGRTVTPHFGRFYPRAMFHGVGPAGGDPMQPFRYLGEAGGAVQVDTRHPLAGYELTLIAEVTGDASAAPKRARPVDWTARLLDGPGMQACWDGEPTVFDGADAYRREDESPDAEAGATPRTAAHLDAQAEAAVGDYYRGILAQSGTVLDLMSGRHACLPADAKPAHLTGLGLDAAEMLANDMLDDAVVADLNALPALPFADSAFDTIICTLSVAYLTQPVAVFREAHRVLRPGGTFALTFSDRWYPPKVTRLWTELHSFERLGLVAGYFAEAGGFVDIETYSLRGLPRPPDDPHAARAPHADPVFAVAARREEESAS